MAPWNEVLSTYELVEDILLHLPLKELLRAQRVSKTWNAIITRSQNIQQALYLKPSTDEGFSYQRVYREYYREIIDNDDDHDCIGCTKQWRTLHGRVKHPDTKFLLNPLLNEYVLFNNGDFSIAHDGFIGAAEEAVPVSLRLRSPAFHHQDANWRRMQIAKPPIRRIDLLCRFGNAGARCARKEGGYTHPAEYIWFIKNEHGVMIGEVVSALRDHLDDCPTCPTDRTNTLRSKHDSWEVEGESCWDMADSTWSGWHVLRHEKNILDKSLTDDATRSERGHYFGDAAILEYENARCLRKR